MSESLYALALLACPLGMGAMMWFMMRGQQRPAESEGAASQAQLVALRATVDQLQAQHRETDGRRAIEGNER